MMRNLWPSRLPVAAAFVLLASSACSEHIDRTPGPVTAAWEQSWNASVDRLISDVANEYGDNVSAEVEPTRKAAFLEDMQQTFLDELSWEAMGMAAVDKRLREICGISLLNELGPYFAGESPRDEMPDRLKSESASCAVEINLFVTTSPAYAMYEIASRELPSLYRKHGIDPKNH